MNLICYNLYSIRHCFYLNYLLSIVLMGHNSMQVIVCEYGKRQNGHTLLR